MANHDIFRSEINEHLSKIDNTENTSPDSGSHQMKMEWIGNKARINLAGTEATAMAVPLRERPFSPFVGSKISDIDKAVAERVVHDIEGGDIEGPKEQLLEQAEKTHASGDDLKKIAELFRDFGSEHIYAYDGGIDMRYYGHSFDLNSFGLVYIIPETLKSKMIEMMSNGIDDANTGMRGQFRMNKRMFEFQMGHDDERGFSVSVKFGDVEQKILFLLGEVEGADRSFNQKSKETDLLNGGAQNLDTLESNSELSEEDLKLYDEFVKIYKKHGDNAENCKKEILEYLVEKPEAKISIALRSELEANEMFKNRIPADIEIQKAKQS